VQDRRGQIPCFKLCRARREDLHLSSARTPLQAGAACDRFGYPAPIRLTKSE